MIKKVIILGAVVALVVVLLAGTSAISYVRTSAGYVKESVLDAVPMEFEIKRARGEIENLLPEIRKNMYVIAKEEVEVQGLQKQVAEAETGLDKAKGEIMRLNTDMKTGQSEYVYAGRTFSSGQVKVTRRFRWMSRTSNLNPSWSLGSITSPAVQNGSAKIRKSGKFHAPGEVLSAMKIKTVSAFRSTNSISAHPGPRPFMFPEKASERISWPAP